LAALLSGDLWAYNKFVKLMMPFFLPKLPDQAHGAVDPNHLIPSPPEIHK